MSKRINLQLTKIKASMSNAVNGCSCMVVEIRSISDRSVRGRMHDWGLERRL